jgi:hypothetical protein
MNIFSNLRVYAGKWSVVETRAFTDEEVSQVSQAVIVPSQYGNSVQFTMRSGGLTYIPLDQNSDCSIGEVIDLTKAKLITLTKKGEADIYRINI